MAENPILFQPVGGTSGQIMSIDSNYLPLHSKYFQLISG